MESVSDTNAIILDAHYRRIRGRFVDRILAREPGSVLEVGCGSGFVLERLAEAGVRAEGVEADASLVDELLARGLSVHHGEAESLVAEDEAFEWVSFCHVLHHLRDPGTAIAEAFRVCRRGVMVAEPWFDESLATQRLALEFDRWLKRQHRRVGRVHEENLGPAEILALVPSSANPTVEVERYLHLEPRAPEWFDEQVDDPRTGLAPDNTDWVESDALLRRIRAEGATKNGTLLVTLEISGR